MFEIRNVSHFSSQYFGYRKLFLTTTLAILISDIVSDIRKVFEFKVPFIAFILQTTYFMDATDIIAHIRYTSLNAISM